MGALGANAEECRDLFGEFVGAAGGAAFMPTDGTATPDYMLSTAMGLVPTVQALYAITFRGSPGYQLRFEANTPDAGVPLSDIVRASVSWPKRRPSESSWPRTSPVWYARACAARRRGATPCISISLPVREWLSFTPEREFARFSALVVGVASHRRPPAVSTIAPFLRPVSDEYQGHFHAAVTAFRSLPRGKLPVADIVTAWLQPRSVISVVHLLRDARPVEGAGESEFQRGALLDLSDRTRGGAA